MKQKMQIIRNSFVVFTFDFIMGIKEKKVAWINVLHRKLGMRTQNEKGERTQYAFQGYDIVTYFISALHEYGTSFPSNVANYEKSLLQSDIRFEKANSGSGFVNNGVRNINYIGGWSIKPWE